MKFFFKIIDLMFRAKVKKHKITYLLFQKRKVVDSAFKILKPFFINMVICRDIWVQICSIFSDLRSVKLRLNNRAPPTSIRIKRLLTTMLCSNFSLGRQVVFQLQKN